MVFGSKCKTTEIDKTIMHLPDREFFLCGAAGKVFGLGGLAPSGSRYIESSMPSFSISPRPAGSSGALVVDCTDGDRTYRFAVTMLDETRDKYRISVCMG